MFMTKDEIHNLRRRADERGDSRTAMLCCRALGDSLSDAEPGTDGALVREQFTTDEALEEVTRILIAAVEQDEKQRAEELAEQSPSPRPSVEEQMAANFGGRAEPIEPPPGETPVATVTVSVDPSAISRPVDVVIALYADGRVEYTAPRCLRTYDSGTREDYTPETLAAPSSAWPGWVARYVAATLLRLQAQADGDPDACAVPVGSHLRRAIEALRDEAASHGDRPMHAVAGIALGHDDPTAEWTRSAAIEECKRVIAEGSYQE